MKKLLTIPAVLQLAALLAEVSNHGAEVALLASPGQGRVGDADSVSVRGEQAVEGLLASVLFFVADPIVLVRTGIEISKSKEFVQLRLNLHDKNKNPSGKQEAPIGPPQSARALG